MLCFIALLCFLVFLAVSWWIDQANKPSFLEPRIVATKKYEPRQYYPPKVKTDEDWEQVKERAEYEVLY